MPSIETAVMVAIGALVMIFGWNTWDKTLKPGVKDQADALDVIIGKGKGPSAPPAGGK